MNSKASQPFQPPTTTGIGSEFGLNCAGGYRARLLNPLSNRFSSVAFVSNGRAALRTALAQRIEQRGNNPIIVLLPSYLCYSMLQPFHEAGVRIKFYPITATLGIKEDRLKEKLDANVAAVMLMHYFGFPQPEDVVARLVGLHPDIWIIDDRTHLLLTDLVACVHQRDNRVAIYSVRKWGPFPDLGLVAPGLSTTSTRHGVHSQDAEYDLAFGLLRLIGLLLRGLSFLWSAERLCSLSLRPLRKADAILDQRVLPRRATPVSVWLWRHWDWLAAARVRRRNYLYLLEHWPRQVAAPIFDELPEGVVPLGFPIRTPEREHLKSFLILNHIYPPIHWLRPSQVDPVEFPESALLAEEELTIPIDQRYDLRHMDYILETVSQL